MLAVVSLPLALATAAVFVPGCGSSEELNDICGWLRDPQNCYRNLFDDVRTRCGAVFDEASAADVKNSGPVGRFVQRSTLDTCVLQDPVSGQVAGQVQFDTTPAFEQFPLTTLQVTRLDARSEPCSSIVVTSPYTFSIDFRPCTEDPTDIPPVCQDALDGAGSVSGVGRDPEAVTGGAFSIVQQEGRAIYTTTCPSGEAFRFNRLESAKCDGYERLLPRAEIDSYAGATAAPWETDTAPFDGWIRLRLTYPPYEGDLEGAEPTVIQYFNCAIPFQNPCADGLKNFFETDVDCGGPRTGESPASSGGREIRRECPRCESGQICADDSDCLAPATCVTDPASGFLRCTDPNPPASGAGGDAGGGGAGGAGGSN
ncbi:hypothetical protein [Chondromyces crocatus]|uniref:hypothetical protein n=1 Tax=Chondromyces crocatus TaxID=52 RepID=UPI0012E13263|nr:hypothetical protein [Chondromyces crocatus]